MIAASRTSVFQPMQAAKVRPFTSQRTAVRSSATTYKVEVQHQGKTYNMDVPAGQNVLEVALDKYKLDLPHGVWSDSKGFGENKCYEGNDSLS